MTGALKYALNCRNLPKCVEVMYSFCSTNMNINPAHLIAPTSRSEGKERIKKVSNAGPDTDIVTSVMAPVASILLNRAIAAFQPHRFSTIMREQKDGVRKFYKSFPGIFRPLFKAC